MRLALQHKVPDMTMEMIRFLDFRSEDLYPMTLLTVSILEKSRKEKLSLAFCPRPSGIANLAPEKRKTSAVCR